MADYGACFLWRGPCEPPEPSWVGVLTILAVAVPWGLIFLLALKLGRRRKG